MYRQIFLSAMLLMVLSAPARADEAARVLSWEDCVKEALAHNPDLVVGQEKLNQAKAVKGLTRSNALPQVSGNLSFTTQKSAGSSNTKNYAYGASARQLLFDGGKTAYDLQSANANIRAAAYDYAVVSSNVRLNLRVAFIDLLNAQEFLNVAQNIAKRRKSSLDLVTLRYQGGAEHQGSLLTAQANFAQAEFDIEQARRAILLSQRRLGLAMGWDTFVSVVAKGDFETGAFDRQAPDFQQMVDTVPFLKELTAQKESAKLGVKSARANFFPQIYANADAGRSDSRWPPAQNSWSAGFMLTVPIFEGGLQQAQMAQARAVLGQAEANERSGRHSVLLTLAGTWTQWQDAVEYVGIQKKFLEAAQKREQIAEAEYGSGLITFNEWIIIENNLVNTQKQFLGAGTDALAAEAGWAQAKGETLDE